VNRYLYDEVLTWISPQSRVLDLGSGDGSFLERVALERKAHVEGVERNPTRVSECIKRHLIVHQGDVLDGLDQYSKDSFDLVMLLGTFQELIDPSQVIREAFRVGRQVIISFTNFAYWRARLQLFLTGRAPVTQALPSAWYRTSNTHFFSILDFDTFCHDLGMNIVRSGFFAPKGPVRTITNLRAECAVKLLEPAKGSALERYRTESEH
jgi:methionine biosynthesis protein MetW